MGTLHRLTPPQQETEALKGALKAWRDYSIRRYALHAIDRRDAVIRHTLVLLGVA